MVVSNLKILVISFVTFCTPVTAPCYSETPGAQAAVQGPLHQHSQTLLTLQCEFRFSHKKCCNSPLLLL